MNVTLGAHNIKKQEKTQQVIPVKRTIPHPDYDPDYLSNDIMLLQVSHVTPLSLAHFNPGGLHPHGLLSIPPSQNNPFTCPRTMKKVIHDCLEFCGLLVDQNSLYLPLVGMEGQAD
ncbi:granzyme B-like protein [Leptotrombidium deliense]|uniref:Granzyme B-like protein n=1 Tax=Leptotrombidium deliense TaxID=299467 RepID=A0A443QGV8_9ACAR|nr:granzyme B-like protein [Leptotrombidium deliense]